MLLDVSSFVQHPLVWRSGRKRRNNTQKKSRSADNAIARPFKNRELASLCVYVFIFIERQMELAEDLLQNEAKQKQCGNIFMVINFMYFWWFSHWRYQASARIYRNQWKMKGFGHLIIFAVAYVSRLNNAVFMFTL